MFASAETALTSIGSLTLASPVVLSVVGGVSALAVAFFVVRLIRARKAASGNTAQVFGSLAGAKAGGFLKRAEGILQQTLDKAIEDATRQALAALLPGLAPIITGPIIDVEDKLLKQVGGQLTGQPSVPVPPGHDVILLPKDDEMFGALKALANAIRERREKKAS